MAHSTDPLAHAHGTATEWLRVVAEVLDTEDRVFAHRVLRAWLHVVRDRLPVDGAAHLAAQLPEFLRGVFYEGWTPSRVPVAHDVALFRREFAHEAGVGVGEVPELSGRVFEGLDSLFSPGQLDHVLDAFPVRLGDELTGRVAEGDDELDDQVPGPAGPDDARLAALEDSVRSLTDALAVLARGLEDLPTQVRAEDGTARAAQEAHRILLARGVAAR